MNEDVPNDLAGTASVSVTPVFEPQCFSSPSPRPPRSQSDQQLSEQINELQDAVKEMKSAFTSALHELGSVDNEDNTVYKQFDKYRDESQEQLAEVVKLILSMKTEFSVIKSQVQLVQESQYSLQRQLNVMLYERDMLIEELENNGVISEQARKRLHNCRSMRHPPSGSQSNDSGVAFLIEKAHAAFQQNHPSITTPQSDQDSNSLPENVTNRVSSMVHEYLAGLRQTNHDENNSNVNNQDYDSDSSLTAAANKSLTLSTSLGKLCGLELDHQLKDVADNQSLAKECIDDSMPFITKNKPSSVLKKSASHEKSSKEKLRHKVAEEIVENERIYCKTLWILQDNFAEPLKKSGILTNRDVDSIFPQEIYSMYEKHCTLLQKLEDRLSSWKNDEAFIDILENFTDPKQSDALNLYTSYVNDFSEIIKTFQKSCKQSGKFTKFLKNCLDQPSCANTDLGALLLAPVQRIPAYILSLKKVSKWTNEDQADSRNIKICLARLKEFLNRLNDTMEHSFQLIAGQMSHTSDFLCEDKFIDDDYNEARSDSVHNAETILLDDCSDAESLQEKIQMFKAEFDSKQVLETKRILADSKCEGPTKHYRNDTNMFGDNASSKSKIKQVPKKPPRTPRKSSYQNEIYRHDFVVREPECNQQQAKPSSSPDVSHLISSCPMNGCCCKHQLKQTVTDVHMNCSCCQVAPPRSLSCHFSNSHQHNYEINRRQSKSTNSKREMGRSMNCIHETPISISNSQSSLKKSQSVNRVSEWKNYSTVSIAGTNKKMGKMKSLRTSLKNLFKKRKSSVDMRNIKDNNINGDVADSSTFIQLEDDFHEKDSTA